MIAQVQTTTVIGPFIVFLLVLALFIFWLAQLIHLMNRRDDFFPGHNDKLIWAALFVFIAPLAPFAYFFWKVASEAERLKTASDPRR